jgi:hypothetical protein
MILKDTGTGKLYYAVTNIDYRKSNGAWKMTAVYDTTPVAWGRGR